MNKYMNKYINKQSRADRVGDGDSWPSIHSQHWRISKTGRRKKKALKGNLFIFSNHPDPALIQRASNKNKQVNLAVILFLFVCLRQDLTM
jgi:hypothetical protein